MSLALMKLEDKRVAKRRRRMYSVLNNDTNKAEVSAYFHLQDHCI